MTRAEPSIANLEEITLLEHFKGPEELHQRVRSHGGLDRRVLAVTVNEGLDGAVDVDIRNHMGCQVAVSELSAAATTVRASVAGSQHWMTRTSNNESFAGEMKNNA